MTKRHKMEESYVFASMFEASNVQIRVLKCFELNGNEYAACGDKEGILHILVKKGGHLEAVKSLEVSAATITAIEFVRACQFCDQECVVLGNRGGVVQFWTAASLTDKTAEPVKVHEITKCRDCVCHISATCGGAIICDTWDNKTRIESREGCIEMSHGDYSAWSSIEEPDGTIISGV